METEIYRCSSCNVVRFGSGLKPVPDHLKKKVYFFCPQDGGKMRRITNTKKGQALLKLRNDDSWKES